MIINKEEQSAAIGMILGDGYLQKTGARNARLRLEHRADHAEYLVWKTRLLPKLFQGKAAFLKRMHPKTKHSYSYVRQQSNASPWLGKLRSLFYGEGRRTIPQNLPKLLKSDIGFAVWFYDDGYYFVRDRAYYLYLGTVRQEEAETARVTLNRNFGLKSRVLNKKQKGFCLYFPVSEREKIRTILKKHYVPVMSYKVGAPS
jgi:hypothetical protein